MSDWRTKLRRLGFWAPSLKFGSGATPAGCACCESPEFAGSSGGSSVAPDTYEGIDSECGPCDRTGAEDTTPRYFQIEIDGVTTIDACNDQCPDATGSCEDADGSYVVEHTDSAVAGFPTWINFCTYKEPVTGHGVSLVEELCAQTRILFVQPVICSGIGMSVVLKKYDSGNPGSKASLTVSLTSGSSANMFGGYRYDFEHSIWPEDEERCIGNPAFDALFPLVIPRSGHSPNACSFPGSVTVHLVPE